ncbi:helix-turn-helix transcriptional regulator [Henriciella sp. AS95]|uniref:PadR family transcriptional regulator n=1 Tax=Henriciella sp. AS95 TaxID=3135782 RepID=UPI0031792EFF
MSDFPRISAKERAILDVLIAHGELYGLQIVRAADGIKRGSVYVMLMRLEEKGLVSSRIPAENSVSGKPRPRYRVTGVGQRAMNALELWSSQNVGSDQVAWSR